VKYKFNTITGLYWCREAGCAAFIWVLMWVCGTVWPLL